MPDLHLYWGELHNHNELGYAQGSLERSYEIARSHLDFYAFTPHGLHADGGVPDGYPVVVANWERIRRAARQGTVVLIPSHRSHFDYLLLSYIVYQQGLSLPHVAAGVNLNMPGIGAILRRGGAFY